MVSHLDIGLGDRVLEPSAGTGALIDALAITHSTDRATRELRARLEEYGAHIQPLPEDTFAVSGVCVHTVLIALTTPDK